MQTVLITGANRGIGLALTAALAARGDRVFAGCRMPDAASELKRLAAAHPDRIIPLAIDVSELPSIRAAVDEVRLQAEQLDLLINNAGINPPGEDQELEYIDFATMLRVLRTNTAGPLMVAQQCLPLLRKSPAAKVVNLSSEMGSIEGTNGGGYYAYSTSKAGLNMVSRILANDLARYEILVLALDPGWVQTDMGGPDASITPEESAEGILRVIDGLTQAGSGAFLRYDGERHAW